MKKIKNNNKVEGSLEKFDRILSVVVRVLELKKGIVKNLGRIVEKLKGLF